MYVCMYVCVYVCMYVYIYVCVCVCVLNTFEDAFFLLGDSLASEFYVPVFVCSIFIGGLSRKNNWDEIVGVFIQEKVWLKNSLSQSRPWIVLRC